MTRKFVSSGAHFCAVIATMNLVLMAAIANDESVGNRTSSSSVRGQEGVLVGRGAPTVISNGGPSPQKAMASLSIAAEFTRSVAPTTSSLYYPPSPSIQSLVKSQSFDYTVNTKSSGGEGKINGNSSAINPSPLLMVPGVARSSVSHVNQQQPLLYNSDNTSNSTISSIDVLMNSSTSPFVTLNSTVLRAQYKSNALLPCNVRNSGDGVTVSWIRRKDYHLLTVGLQTYSSDDRFTAIHAQSPDDWTLKIKYIQPRDAGLYECQVSTHPPSSIFVTLHVVEARAEIIGGPDKFYKAGSSVELRCDLIDSTEEPEYVFWYQGLRMINYDPSRHINVTHSKTSSMLVIHNVGKMDSGNYTCVPSNAHPASIFVHIINGENPAAMQHGSHSTTCVPCPPLWFLSFLLSLTLQTFYLRFLSRNVDHNHQQEQHRRYHRHYQCTGWINEAKQHQRNDHHQSDDTNLSLQCQHKPPQQENHLVEDKNSAKQSNYCNHLAPTLLQHNRNHHNHNRQHQSSCNHRRSNNFSSHNEARGKEQRVRHLVDRCRYHLPNSKIDNLR